MTEVTTSLPIIIGENIIDSSFGSIYIIVFDGGKYYSDGEVMITSSFTDAKKIFGLKLVHEHINHITNCLGNPQPLPFHVYRYFGEAYQLADDEWANDAKFRKELSELYKKYGRAQ